MNRRDIIVIGASAGGVTALIELVKTIPKDFDASIFIVLHVHPTSPSNLPQILSRFGQLDAVHPEDGDKIEKRKIYIAPPDHHILLEKEGRILVKKGPKENRFRPSIDALFRSAAYVYGPRVIGLVLSGLLNDGTSGMWSVKQMGGIGVIQDPDDALYDSMPINVQQEVEVDYTLPVKELSSLLVRLIAEEAPQVQEISAYQMDLMKMEVVIAAHDHSFELGIMNMGKLTPFTCPDCHGTLVSIKDGTTVRYRCHTGHAFTASTLLSGVTESIENQLWSTVRTFEEAIMLLDQIGTNFEEAGNNEAAKQFFNQADISRKRSEVLQKQVLTHQLLSEDFRLLREEEKV
jgi:two-component system chemotaxis response regulator CheB